MKNKLRYWKKITGKVVYESPWIKIHEDKVVRPDGKEGIYGYLEKPVGVFIVPYDEKTETVYFIKQHRYPINTTILEIPAGVTGNGNLLEEAKRELEEETGLKADKWEHLGGFFVAPGHESTRIEVYLASELNKENLIIEGQGGDEAIADIVEIKLIDLPKMIRQGKIECGISLAALNLFLQSKSMVSVDIFGQD